MPSKERPRHAGGGSVCRSPQHLGQEDQEPGQPQLHSYFEVSLGYTRACQRNRGMEKDPKGRGKERGGRGHFQGPDISV